MGLLTAADLSGYWAAPEISANLIVFFNIVGAMFLGMVSGYERTFHGRAAGMRTYAVVCMASAALTAILGHPDLWYGGHAQAVPTSDPTRVVQGILTGIGFLGAGVIMKDGFNISGLTTAASIWAVAAIGVLVGIGFYAAAVLLTALSVACMLLASRLEDILPSHPAMAVTLRFIPGFAPQAAALRSAAAGYGYDIADSSLAISFAAGGQEWRFIAVARHHGDDASVAAIAQELASFSGVESFQVSHARN